jgi:hypothetical protein
MDISTEEKLDSAIELYELDSSEWDCTILLDELERLYKWRETINRLILKFKDDIRKMLDGGE